MKQEAHWLKTMGSSPMIRWKKGQNIVTAQTVSEHFAVSYIFSNYSAPHSQNRSFRAIFLLMWLLRQRNFQNYAHSCKHDSQIYENCLGSE